MANEGEQSQMKLKSNTKFIDKDDLNVLQFIVSTKPESKLLTFDSAEALTAQQTDCKQITEKRTDMNAEV